MCRTPHGVRGLKLKGREGSELGMRRTPHGVRGLKYVKGDDVVVESSSGEFVTILKGGVTNARVKNARKSKI